MRFPRAVEDLLAARELLVTRGWCQGALEESPGGAVCALGAMNAAISGDPYDGSAPKSDYSYARRRACQDAVEFATESDSVVTWNNARGRRLPQVLDGFDAAASLALSEHVRGDK